MEWKDIMDTWRGENLDAPTIYQRQPSQALLAKLMRRLKPDNLKTGFKACGIYSFRFWSDFPRETTPQRLMSFHSLNRLGVLKNNRQVLVEKKHRRRDSKNTTGNTHTCCSPGPSTVKDQQLGPSTVEDQQSTWWCVGLMWLWGWVRWWKLSLWYLWGEVSSSVFWVNI